MKHNLPYLHAFVDRHGRARVYVRRNGKRLPLPTPNDPGFLLAYDAARKKLDDPDYAPPKKTPALKTLAWLGAEYEKSYVFKKLDPRSQRVRHLILEQAFAEPQSVKNPSQGTMGEVPIDELTSKAIKVLRDRKSKTPGAANNRLTALRRLFDWAVEAEHLTVDPSAGVKALEYDEAPFHSWTEDEVIKFAERHPEGSKARLAMSLMLFTGLRKSDAVRVGPSDLKGGVLIVTPQKTKKTGKTLYLPILPELQAILDVSPLGSSTFLETAHGRPFTANGFGGWFRDRCDEAGLPHCSAHGLRKAGATIAAENGATEQQMMAIFGWDSPRLAAHYAKAASQKKLAAMAIHLLIPKASGSPSGKP